MLNDVVEVRPMGGYVVYLRFDDGAEGEIDLGKLITFKGVFEPLKEQARFEEVFVNKELGTICWPSGADLDPCVLYSQVTGAPLPGEHHLAEQG